MDKDEIVGTVILTIFSWEFLKFIIKAVTFYLKHLYWKNFDRAYKERMEEREQ